MYTDKQLVEIRKLGLPLFKAVKEAQEALASWIVPNSGITDSEALNQLLGILDNKELVKQMRVVEPVWSIGDRFTTPETEDRAFTVRKVDQYYVEAYDSRSRSGTTSFAKSYITKL